MSDDPIEKVAYSTFHKVNLDTTLGKLNRILDVEHFALVVHSQRLCKFGTLLFYRWSEPETLV